MPITALDHVQIAMPSGEEAAARAFYCDLLGLTEIAKPEPSASRGGMWLFANGVNIHLGIDPAFIPAKKAHVALQITDYDELMNTLKGNNYPIIIDKELIGISRFFSEDCFGNRLEFIDCKSAALQ